MKDYFEKRRAELKKRGNKGFTLMEMLIVVAIIAVLIAIAIPIFTSQLENSREATDAANLRSAYAEVTASYLTDNSAHSKTVDAQQKTSGWQNSAILNGSIGTIKISDNISGNSNGWIVTVTESGSVSITVKS